MFDMSFVLTSDLGIYRRLPSVTYINRRTVRNYENRPEIRAIVCSREIAGMCEKLRFPNLRLIQLLSAGFDEVDIQAYKSRGVSVCNAANVYSVAMAEFVVMGILQSAKRYHHYISDRSIRYTRNYKYITELSGKNVLILGVGGIGNEIAKRLYGFGTKLYGYARSCRGQEGILEITDSVDRLKQLLAVADYVVSTLPDNPQTRGFICRELLCCLPERATIINVGRHCVFNERELYAYLRSHLSVSAYLDMFEKLPNPFTNKFRRLRNVVVWPGVTAISQESRERLRELVAYNLEQLKSGNPAFLNLL